MAIYKYVTEERIDILENGFIRFTQPSAFNDPFEVYPYFKSIADNDSVENLIAEQWSHQSLEKIIEERFQEQLNEKPFLRLIPDFEKTFKEGMAKLMPMGRRFAEGILKIDSPETRSFVLSSIRQALDKTIGILCLTEKPDNLLMWAHYSNCNQGFVIEFDEKNRYFDQRKEEGELRGYLRKVNYSIERPEIVLFDLRLDDTENLNIWINKFFWNKSAVWQYEQEWRMIETLKECKDKIENDTHEICLFPIPLDCVTGIILGCRMPEEMRRKLAELLNSDKRYSHIKLKQAAIDEKDFQLNIV